jgi:hypothetical protein
MATGLASALGGLKNAKNAKNANPLGGGTLGALGTLGPGRESTNCGRSGWASNRLWHGGIRSALGGFKNAKAAKTAKAAKAANPWKLAVLAVLGRAGHLIGAEEGAPQQIVAGDARATISRRIA